MKLWNSRRLRRTLGSSFFEGFPLHLQGIMTSRDMLVWLTVTITLLIVQWCNIKKTSVFLLLNMHIIISSWQMLYLHCLIIRSYCFSRILCKGKKNYMSPPHSLIWPIKGCAAGPGYGFRSLCPKQGYMILHESVLNRVHNFVQVLIWPIRVGTLNAFLTHFNNPT